MCVPGIEATTVAKQLDSARSQEFRAKLPAGYGVVLGGVIEDSAKAQASIFVVFPLMLFLMVTILMVQLMSFQRLFLVLLTAPLALIGVAGALLVSRAPMGFVAILGVISLIGMVIRNSVILIAQIDQHIADGEHPWSAVISATEHRLRPILLTAAAAILGMIPIAPTVFWGPMAYAVMGGLVVATLLTLVFLPALYVAWFRIKPEHAARIATAQAQRSRPASCQGSTRQKGERHDANDTNHHPSRQCRLSSRRFGWRHVGRSAGAFLRVGPQRPMLGAAPHAAIGFVEAHGLAFIIGVLLWRAEPVRMLASDRRGRSCAAGTRQSGVLADLHRRRHAGRRII